jgi:predicted Zn-dependent peptidase
LRNSTEPKLQEFISTVLGEETSKSRIVLDFEYINFENFNLNDEILKRGLSERLQKHLEEYKDLAIAQCSFVFIPDKQGQNFFIGYHSKQDFEKGKAFISTRDEALSELLEKFL